MPKTRCRKVKEEFVLHFREEEDGRRLSVAFHRHVSACPDCAKEAESTRRIVTIVRERCGRRSAPGSLRDRILAGLRHGEVT